LQVSNVVARMVQAHDNGQEELEAAAMSFFKANLRAFQREAMETLAELRRRPDLMELALNLMTAFGAALSEGAARNHSPTPSLPNGGAVLAALAGSASA